ncbi:hypothetical protein BKA15_006007 [Microlunatus parietis]|uniref:Uncharacterized protein n=1 Tax=Microlunatus parietis TaxID=682979 RepID=A0A7Y9IDS7_9ACTN|nr:hypothetical protein [Microlunatus parietis]
MSEPDVRRLRAGEEREALVGRVRARFGMTNRDRSQVTDWLEESGAVPMAIAGAVLGVFLVVKIVISVVGGS